MNEFERIFKSLGKQYSPISIWHNWMDWVIDANLITNKNRCLDFLGLEEEYYELYKAWLKIVSTHLESTDDYYYDYLGDFFEEHLITKVNKKSDQIFLTPPDVSKLMTGLVNMDDTGFVYDCACGSARLLLDSHKSNPSNIMIGWDYDILMSRMAVLNFYIHGIRGSIIRKNTLTDEYFEAWRVNNYLGYGLPVPHIELVSQSEAYHFIGRNIESGKKEVVTSPEPQPEPQQEVVKPKNGTLEAWL